MSWPQYLHFYEVAIRLDKSLWSTQRADSESAKKYAIILTRATHWKTY